MEKRQSKFQFQSVPKSKQPRLINCGMSPKQKNQMNNRAKTQIAELKHAFAMQQLYASKASVNTNSNQNTSISDVWTLIQKMESNVWMIVFDLLCEFLCHSEWTHTKYRLFALFAKQISPKNTMLTSTFMVSTILGMYTLICHFSNYWSLIPQKSTPTTRSRSTSNTSSSSNSSTHSSKKNKDDYDVDHAVNASVDDEFVRVSDFGLKISPTPPSCSQLHSHFVKAEFDQRVYVLDWYFTLIRFRNLLNESNTESLSKIVNSHRKMISPLFILRDSDSNFVSDSLCSNNNTNILKELVVSILGDSLWNEYLKLNSKNMNTSVKVNWKQSLNQMEFSVIDWLHSTVFNEMKQNQFYNLYGTLILTPGMFLRRIKDPRPARLIQLHKRFNLDAQQELMQTYVCALDIRMVLHTGKMYVFSDYITFFSNVLGRQKKLVFKMENIYSIARLTTALVFRNAIQITLKNRNAYAFRTFINREQAFAFLEKRIRKRNRYLITDAGIKKHKVLHLSHISDLEINNEENNGNGDRSFLVTNSASMAIGSSFKKGAKSFKKLVGLGKKDRDLSNSETLSKSKSDPTVVNANTAVSVNVTRKNQEKKEIITNKSEEKTFEDGSGSESESENESETMPEPDSMRANEFEYEEEESKESIDTEVEPLALSVSDVSASESVDNDEHILRPDMPSLVTIPNSDGNVLNKSNDDKKDECMKIEANEQSTTTTSMSASAVDVPNDLKSSIENSDKDKKKKKKKKKRKKESDGTIVDLLLFDSLTEADKKAQECDGMNLSDPLFSVPGLPKITFEFMTAHEFNCSVDSFWNYFMGNNATYGVDTFCNENPKNEKVVLTKWKEANAKHFQNAQTKWFERTLDLVSKIGDDLPPFLQSSDGIAKIGRVSRYSLLKDGYQAMIIHRITQVQGIPFSDSYSMHEKWEIRQKCKIEDESNKKRVVLTTQCNLQFACEWYRNLWVLKNQIKNQSMKGTKEDIEKWFKVADSKIKEMKESQKQTHTTDATNVSIKQKNKTVSKKHTKKKRTKKLKSTKKKLTVSKNNDKIETKPAVKTVKEEDLDYDFVFRIGGRQNSNFILRCAFNVFRNHEMNQSRFTLCCLVCIVVVTLYFLVSIWSGLNTLNHMSEELKDAQTEKSPLTLNANELFVCETLLKSAECNGFESDLQFETFKSTWYAFKCEQNLVWNEIKENKENRDLHQRVQELATKFKQF